MIISSYLEGLSRFLKPQSGTEEGFSQRIDNKALKLCFQMSCAGSPSPCVVNSYQRGGKNCAFSRGASTVRFDGFA